MGGVLSFIAALEGHDAEQNTRVETAICTQAGMKELNAHTVN
jgi:hypothetical protein